MIDMHAHWKPAQIADALRARAKEPRILRNQDGAEVLKSRMGEEPLASAFDDVGFHLGRMDRQGVETSVLSLLGTFCWIESQPPEVSVPLCRSVNDGLSAICQKHRGRFAAFAALPLSDMNAAVTEFERALTLPSVIGAQLPGNYFLTRKDAEAARPLLESANRHRAVLFIHHGPRPGDAFPKVANDTDNARRRNGTLDMQASLSSTMVTLCLTDLLADYPDLTVVVHNLGGNLRTRSSAWIIAACSTRPKRNCRRRASARPGCMSIATRSARTRSRRRCGSMAPNASCAAPTAPSSASIGLARRWKKPISATKRASRSCTATPPRCSPAPAARRGR